MKWKYYFPHVWKKERELWEDVYLLPDVKEYEDEAIWLTVTAIPLEDTAEPLEEEYVEVRKKLRPAPYMIEDAEMYVPGEGFTQEELCRWVKIWLEQTGFEADELLPGVREDFADRCEHARIVDTLIKKDQKNTMEQPIIEC